MITTKTTTQEDKPFKVMRLLESNPYIAQRELAKELGLNLGSINYCLKALMDKDLLLKMKNFADSKNKFGYVYILMLGGISEKAMVIHQLLKRKMDEYQPLKAEIETFNEETELKQKKTHG